MHLLLEAFPDARVLYAVRYYQDTVNSVSQIFGDDPARRVQAWVGSGFAEQPRFRAPGWNGSQDLYARLLQVTEGGLDTPSWTALYWLIQTGFLLELGMAQDPRIKVIRYKRLVTQPEQTFRDMCAFMGIEYTPLLSDGVHKKSIGKSPPLRLHPEVEAMCRQHWDKLLALVEQRVPQVD